MLTFSQALELLKQGKKVQRVGWNGKGMWLCYMPPLTIANQDINERTRKHLSSTFMEDLHINGYIVMWTADRKWQPGWLASQTDMLASDWQEVND